MGATPSQIENEVAEPDSESDDDEVIKIQHHRRYRVSVLLVTYFRLYNKKRRKNTETFQRSEVNISCLITCFHYATTIS